MSVIKMLKLYLVNINLMLFQYYLEKVIYAFRQKKM
jgi:hypothetical protein